MVKLLTNFGEITLELDAEKAPITVANFLQYVDNGFYDGTIFHRVIDGFMIQGGGFDTTMNQK
ncbi:MAG: peptidylprolyl isomerase, partial [Pseudomonadota bacterium]